MAAEGLNGASVAADIIMWVIMRVAYGQSSPGDAVSVLHSRGLWQKIPEIYLFLKDFRMHLSYISYVPHSHVRNWLTESSQEYPLVPSHQELGDLKKWLFPM